MVASTDHEQDSVTTRQEIEQLRPGAHSVEKRPGFVSQGEIDHPDAIACGRLGAIALEQPVNGLMNEIDDKSVRRRFAARRTKYPDSIPTVG